MSVRPGQPGSACVEDRPEPVPAPDELLVQGICVGICGTDREVADGRHGRAPDGATRIVLGHESLGTVVHAPDHCGLSAGDLVAGVVRRPDPQPCARCAAGEWDSCLNGRYTSCGISGRDGYGAQRWCVSPGHAVRIDPELGVVGVLVEPTSVLMKAWERIDMLAPAGRGEVALVSGAGTLGLLAAMLAVQRNYRTYVVARRWTTRRRELLRRLPAVPLYPEDVARHPAPAVVLDTTGSPTVVAELIRVAARNAVVCLTGLNGQAAESAELQPLLHRLVTTNGTIFGTVNAARRHYEQAASTLAATGVDWLGGLITRHVRLAAWPEALVRSPADVKVVVDLTTAS
jgi:threonine dehydrogenase-like Zn-dependent dehydrogenase